MNMRLGTPKNPVNIDKGNIINYFFECGKLLDSLSVAVGTRYVWNPDTGLMVEIEVKDE